MGKTGHWWWAAVGAVCASVLMAGATGPALAQASAEGIGTVFDVAAAAGTPPGAERRDLTLDDSVFRDEAVETFAADALHVVFRDQTDLRLGENSRLVLEQFIYEGGTGSDALVLRLQVGIIRIASGLMPKAGFRIETPVATIGIRGTVFEVTVDDGETSVAVFEGAVDVTPRAAAPVAVAAGRAVDISAEGDSDVLVDAVPSSDSGLRGAQGRARAQASQARAAERRAARGNRVPAPDIPDF